MGIECICEVEGSGSFASAVTAALREDERLVVLAETEGVISLRFTPSGPRAGWSEDAVIHVRERSVFITVHTARASHCDVVVQLVERAIRGSGCSVRTTEV
jgi:hypothetical protein